MLAAFVIALLSLLLSCSTHINEYKGSSPQFDIKEYFSGNVIGWGMVQDYNQQVTRRFCVELIGTWQGNQGELAETFYFADGEVSYRTWQLTKPSGGQYTGVAEDVIGQASGQQNGFAFNLHYVLDVEIGDSSYQFTMDDWMYQLDSFRVFNRTQMSKFGIPLANITLFFDKQNPNASCQYQASNT